MLENDGPLVDLHCHSSCSGGAIGTPMAAAAYFREHGYAAFSLTEHDNFLSLAAARGAAAAEGLEYIAGIEMSVRVDDPDLPENAAHLLGFDYRITPELRRLADQGVARQTMWVREGVERMRRLGIADVSEEDLRAWIPVRFGPEDVWKRPYSIGPLGDILKARGVLPADGSRKVRDLLEELYPSSDLPPLPDVAEVSRTLAEAGAVRILAHPFGPATEANQQERRRLETWLARYADGLELYRPYSNPAYQEMIWELVSRLGRPFSGGSDTHTYEEPEKVSSAPYACLESIRQWKERL